MQVARAALKGYRNVVADRSLAAKLSPSNAYLGRLFDGSASKAVPTTESQWLDPTVQTRLLGLRAVMLVRRLDTLATKGRRSWASLSWECQAVCRAVVESFLVDRVNDALRDGGLLMHGLGPAEQEAVQDLMQFVRLKSS